MADEQDSTVPVASNADNMEAHGPTDPAIAAHDDEGADSEDDGFDYEVARSLAECETFATREYSRVKAQPLQCPVDDCQHASGFEEEENLAEHLTSVHSNNDELVKELVQIAVAQREKAALKAQIAVHNDAVQAAVAMSQAMREAMRFILEYRRALVRELNASEEGN